LPAVALCYAQGARGAVLVADLDLDEFGPAQVTQDYWLLRDAKRFVILGRFDQFITAVIPAKDLRTQLRRQGLRNARDDAKGSPPPGIHCPGTPRPAVTSETRSAIRHRRPGHFWRATPGHFSRALKS
jgi:hypothetical protein